MDYSKVLKFNPYHGKDGKFSSKGGATITDVTGSGTHGVTMGSPSLLNDSKPEQGQANLSSREQRSFMQMSRQVDSTLGIAGHQRSALGAWADGGENSVVTFYQGVDLKSLEASASLKGLLAQQKNMVVFHARKGGDSQMHSVSGVHAESHVALSKFLISVGVENHSIIKTGNTFTVMSMMGKRDKQSSALTKLALVYGGKHTFQTGDGVFIGDPNWSSRHDANKDYAARLKKFTKGKPTLAKAVSSMIATHKYRKAKFDNILGGVQL